jgi:hypothetical protein
MSEAVSLPTGRSAPALARPLVAKVKLPEKRVKFRVDDESTSETKDKAWYSECVARVQKKVQQRPEILVGVGMVVAGGVLGAMAATKLMSRR